MTFRRFLRKGPEALVPHFVDGKWRRPMVSAREAARLRKVAITNGTYGSFELGKGGWLPEWDFKYTDRPKILKPNKGHKRERTREERFQNIQTAMEGMDDKIRKHKEGLQALKPKPGIENLFKKLTSSTRRR